MCHGIFIYDNIACALYAFSSRICQDTLSIVLYPLRRYRHRRRCRRCHTTANRVTCTRTICVRSFSRSHVVMDKWSAEAWDQREKNADIQATWKHPHHHTHSLTHIQAHTVSSAIFSTEKSPRKSIILFRYASFAWHISQSRKSCKKERTLANGS